MNRSRCISIVYTLVAAASLLAPCASCLAQLVNDASPRAVAINTAWWQRNVASGKEFRLPIGTLYINGTASTPAAVGVGPIKTKGAFVYPIGPHEKSVAGNFTRIVQLGKGPVLRDCGTGMQCNDPLWLVGDGESAAIEVEGRTYPSTGRSKYSNICFQGWGCAFKALGGYYQDGKFVADENHADNVTATNCHTFQMRKFFRSENVQALNWNFIECGMWDLCEQGQELDCIFADIDRGGDVVIDRLVGSALKLTVFRVNWYSPNTNLLVCRDYRGDRRPVPGYRLTPLEYAETPGRVSPTTGKPVPGADWQTPACDYNFTFTGKVATHQADCEITYKVPDNFPRKRWKIDLEKSEAAK